MENSNSLSLLFILLPNVKLFPTGVEVGGEIRKFSTPSTPHSLSVK